MESSNLPDSIEDLPEPLRNAIEKLIESKVEEKWNNFVQQHPDVFDKNKKPISAIKRVPG